jgi:Na+-translocating ferredoxin:NAD+ oxidoreductase subunit B
MNPVELCNQLDGALPQTQCTKCGYPDCRSYAAAMADEGALPNRCPPGGAEGIKRLSSILLASGRQLPPHLQLESECGIERPRPVALIDPKTCIGCTLCIQACPVDAIVGASKQMHVVLTEWCTGCDLCVPPCPVDCISMVSVTESRTGWDAWTAEQAVLSRTRYHRREDRLEREERDNNLRLSKKAEAKLKALNEATASGSQSVEQAQESERKRAIIAAAIERAKLAADKNNTK